MLAGKFISFGLPQNILEASGRLKMVMSREFEKLTVYVNYRSN